MGKSINIRPKLLKKTFTGWSIKKKILIVISGILFRYCVCAYRSPMTPQATLDPACPVVKLSVNPPRPKSSLSACTTTARPRMLWVPTNEMMESWYLKMATPELSAWMVPKSPTCLLASLGPPCLFCKTI